MNFDLFFLKWAVLNLFNYSLVTVWLFEENPNFAAGYDGRKQNIVSPTFEVPDFESFEL